MTFPFLIFSPGAGGVSLWTPADLTTPPLAWYEANLISGSEADNISTINDSSTNNNDISNVSRTVNLHLAHLNGLNTLRFPGSGNGYYSLPNIYSGKSAGAAFLISIKDEDPPVIANSEGFWRFGTGSSDHMPYTDGVVYDGFCSTVRKTVGNLSPSFASWRIIGVNSGASDYDFYLDGVLQFPTATNTFGADPVPLLGLSSGGSAYHRGYMAEEIFFDYVLGTDDRQLVEGYLAWKWGLEATNLPAGHPYESAPP
jgi:hypothetical protein